MRLRITTSGSLSDRRTASLGCRLLLSRQLCGRAGWNIDASSNRGFFWRDLDVAKPYGRQLARQAAAITADGPQAHSLLRFGGSGNDVLVYEFGSTICPSGPHWEADHKCLNQTTWRNLLEFTRAANARIIFGICEPKWTGCGAPEQGPHCGPDRKQPCTACPAWDPTNAREILEWTIAQDLDDLIYGLELGNEVDGLYSGSQQARNLQTLHNLTLELWQDASKRPLLLGPDAAHQDAVETAPPFPTPRDAYVYEFFKEAGKLRLPIAGATLHKYIETDTQRDTNASRLDETTVRFRTFQEQVNAGWAASGNKQDAAPRSWGGEIGPHNGGSPPCNHSSMRWATFADSLWYIDALGSAAKLGFEAFCRQDYIGADYGLVDCSTGAPLPDFWSLLLWTRLTSPTVLSANVAAIQPIKGVASSRAGIYSSGHVEKEDVRSNLRLYAHCTPRTAWDDLLAADEDEHVMTGQTTLVAINLGSKQIDLELNTAPNANVTLWQLAPSNEPGIDLATGLNGTGVSINGRAIRLQSDGGVPDMQMFARVLAADGSGSDTQVQLAAQSISFLVYRDSSDSHRCGQS